MAWPRPPPSGEHHVVAILPIQSPGARCLKAQLETSEFGVRKGLLIEKVPTENMGNLVLKATLRKYRAEASFMSRKEGMRRARGN